MGACLQACSERRQVRYKGSPFGSSVQSTPSASLGWRKDADYANGVPVASPIGLFSFVIVCQHWALWVPLHIVDGSSAGGQGDSSSLTQQCCWCRQIAALGNR